METAIGRSLYAHVIIKLLQGPIYSDDKAAWRDLEVWKSSIQEYFGKIGIDLVISEADGFARIVQPKEAEDEENPLPRLMRKQTLNYETTLLCVILRQMLEEFDIKSEGTKLFLTQKDIKEGIELFYKEQTNKSKLWKELSRPINSLMNIGVLKLTREDTVNKDNNQYEVKRIIKALVDNEKLEEIKLKLEAHANTIQSE
ncbi:DUF4194 domain-containing protein [Chitinophaga horti]|uniref:DUF4194 domain-containing protein n=1 Tax=Chitinophaga horti TaxID=2920382 RepID=A0ABY6J2G5_9BACT|nr:DUF4194 domain-containing protein [Chitinophaga horti]UYQ92842.1 DUF4194 domain-containing protein [Chitinophaga horti]